MEIEEIVKSLKVLKTKIEDKDKMINNLQQKNNQLESSLSEVETRLKTTLTAIVKNAKDGMSPTKKEYVEPPTKAELLNG